MFYFRVLEECGWGTPMNKQCALMHMRYKQDFICIILHVRSGPNVKFSESLVKFYEIAISLTELVNEYED